jgi:hypothetical protein
VENLEYATQTTLTDPGRSETLADVWHAAPVSVLSLPKPCLNMIKAGDHHNACRTLIRKPSRDLTLERCRHGFFRYLTALFALCEIKTRLTRLEYKHCGLLGCDLWCSFVNRYYGFRKKNSFCLQDSWMLNIIKPVC